jgi:putative toxin-antitoxin system antitoxin component (TIGR02293 family)
MNDATHVGDATAKANLGNVHPGDSWAKISKSVFQLSPLVRHDVVRDGVATNVLFALITALARIKKQDIYSVIGITEKTSGRRKSETLPPEAADATLSLIEITTLAESVLGSLEDAEQWLVTPAIGLDGRKPIDLISTRAGAEMVKTHLIRMDYGVYA